MIALTTFGPLRIIGGLFAFGMFVAAILRFRRRNISRASFLITSLLSIVIVVMAIDPRLFGPIFNALNFQKGNHDQLIAALLVAVFVLFALILRNMADTDVNRQGLRILVEALTLQSFDWSVTDEFPPGDRLVVVMPAHNEAENIGAVLTSVPQEVEGLRVVTLVIDDASEDETSIAAAKEGALVARLPIRRGQGMALRVGYEIALRLGALVVASLDADGQHIPDELSLVVAPVLRGELEQDQYSSEVLVEALRHHARIKEVPITVRARASGVSKKPSSLRYGWRFTKVVFQTWLR